MTSARYRDTSSDVSGDLCEVSRDVIARLRRPLRGISIFVSSLRRPPHSVARPRSTSPKTGAESSEATSEFHETWFRVFEVHREDSENLDPSLQRPPRSVWRRRFESRKTDSKPQETSFRGSKDRYPVTGEIASCLERFLGRLERLHSVISRHPRPVARGESVAGRHFQRDVTRAATRPILPPTTARSHRREQGQSGPA